jgi:cytochrome c oxidase subunit IV
LVILFFMHVRYSTHLIWIYVAAGVIWLAHLLIFTLTDYATRGWLTVTGW